MTTENAPRPMHRDPRPMHRDPRHWIGFVFSGGLAFLVDALVLALLNRGLGINPFLARFVAIWCAMIVAWQSHRRLTFAVRHGSSLKEFASYAAVAWVSAAVNYAIYSAVLLLRPATDPLVALVVASAAAMVVSYLGMRFGVFRRPTGTGSVPAGSDR